MKEKKWMNVFYKFCIGLGIGVVFGFLFILIRYFSIYLTNGDFGRVFNLTECSNAFFLSAFFLIVVGLSSFVTNQGFFDVIAYGFSTMPFMFHISNERKYEDLISYRDSKVEKRTSNNISWLGYVFSGVFYLIIALIIYAILKTSR